MKCITTYPPQKPLFILFAWVFCFWGLVLSGNTLSGAIPNFNLPALRQLAFSHNLLAGTLPSLRMLVLDSNQLTDSILAAFGNLNALFYLGESIF